MLYLFLCSFVWAFSFGLIKGRLTGLDPNFVAAIRLGLSLLVFVPFLRLKFLNRELFKSFFVLGLVQYGLMYVLYIHSYQYLEAYEVALFTIFTPFYVNMVHDLQSKRFHVRNWAFAALAVVGAFVIVFQKLLRWDFWLGFVLMQSSSLCFAYGQVTYKKIKKQLPHVLDHQVFAVLYAAGLLVALGMAVVTTDVAAVTLTAEQLWTLLYLGVLPSGLCFFLWNVGGTRVREPVLAVMNNLKVPLGVLCALMFFGESVDLVRLLCGGTLVGVSIYLSERLQTSPEA